MISARKNHVTTDGRRMIALAASLVFAWCLSGAESLTTTSNGNSPLRTQTLSQSIHCPVNENIKNGNQPFCLQKATTTFAKSKRDPLYLFGRNKDGDGDNEGDNNSEGEKKKSKIPFFGRLKNRGSSKEGTEEEQALPVAAATAAATASPTSSTAGDGNTSADAAKKKAAPTVDDLKQMAEKARLEAERMDAELTLSKIEKLEKQLLKTKKDPDSGDNGSLVVDDLQHQLDVLQAKLRGEPAPAKPSASTDKTKVAVSPASTQAWTPVSTSLAEVSPDVDISDASVLAAASILAESQNDFKFNTVEDLEGIPDFMLKVVASFVGLKAEPGGDGIDKNEFIKRFQMIQSLDYSFLNKEAPTFDEQQIKAKKAAIVNQEKSPPSSVDTLFSGPEDFSGIVVTKTMIEKADGNATQLAIYCLEYEYYLDVVGKEFLSSQPMDEIANIAITEFFQNSTYFNTLYPKCVSARGENKGEDYVSEEPTAAQIDVLTKTILPAIKFSSSAKPYKVAGGYAITGSHKFEDGDKLIEAIDAEIAKSRPNLVDQITVLYTPSFGPLATDQMNIGGDDLAASLESIMGDEENMLAMSEPILYITGPNIVRDSNPVGLALTSIFGLATAWYLSVYPFLLNDKIASRIDADLQLVEANLQPDLSYLSDLSIPLFFCFMSIQLIHETAHRLVAMSKGVKLSVPVFVPSLITGITSTVTTFKTLPKNKNDMFDISAAGPLAGVVASSVTLAIGAKLTLVSDPATLPALPLDILRQSTLGGAIIDNIIAGSLYVPEGAPTAGITVPLHPFAIAGYVGLIVNALSLLPIGTTDGGRLSMALFNRLDKMSIGYLALSTLLFAGLFGSDLFLFYFSFCLAFQTGNEVPARNEQDSVEFSRVIVALVCYGLAILTLVPVQ